MEKEINIKKVISLLKRKLWIVVLVSIIFTALASIYSYYFKTPLYQSSSKIMITGNDEASEEAFSTLMVLMKEPIVLKHVVERLGLNSSPEGISGQINVIPIGGSQIFQIVVTDADPRRATEIANTTAQVYKEELPKHISFYSIKHFSEARENKWPINQNHTRLMIIGIVVGIIAGIGFVFLLDSLDDTVKSAREIEKILTLPVLGRVSKMNNKNTSLTEDKQGSLKVRGETIGS